MLENLPEVSNHIEASLVNATVALSERLGKDSVEPPGGAISALVAAWAATLAGAAADRSREGWSEAAGACAQARSLRARALNLLERGALAHAHAMKALETRRQAGSEDVEGDEGRDWRLGEALKDAAEPPLELAACALDVAQLARTIASHAAGDVRGDAAVAAQLSAGAARAAAHLVEINLVVGGDRQPAVRARALAEAAEVAAAHASTID
jgi:formiminotetrahydrofolate cyclodeaminase